MYGTTYDTIQNRHRKIRQAADELKKEVESGARGAVATPKKAGGGARAATTTPTPRKAKQGKDALSSASILCLALWMVWCADLMNGSRDKRTREQAVGEEESGGQN